MTDDQAKHILAEAIERDAPHNDGPQPVRHAGYVVHAIGNTIWLTPAGNDDTMSSTRH